MAKQIYDARQIHTGQGITTLDDWRAVHRRGIADAQAAGFEVTETIVDDLVIARISEGRWLFDCLGTPECNSGVAVMPDWPEARCMGLGCGRVYTNIQIPSERKEIEAALIARPYQVTRNWDPGLNETAADLVTENLTQLADEVKR